MNMRPLVTPLLSFSLAFSLFACASTNRPPPPPPPDNSATAGTASNAPLEMTAASTIPAFDCPIHERKVPIGPDRILHCRGIPFSVTFPEGANVVQEKVGPGTSFLGLMQPAGITALAVRPATFETTTTNDPLRGLDQSLDQVIASLKSHNPQVDRRYDVKLGNIAGRALDFSYPVGSKKVAGSMHAFLVGGWVAVLIAGGPNDSVMYRGSAEGTKFLDSLRIAPVDPHPVVVTLEGGAQLILPPDAWLSEDQVDKLEPGILRERTYALPELGTMFWLQEQQLESQGCAQFISEQTSRPFLEQQLRSTRELDIVSLEHKKLTNGEAVFVESTVSNARGAAIGLPKIPSTAALFCKAPSLFLALVTGTRAPREHRATLESIVATYTASGAAHQLAR